jgi:hypothetical protein
MADRYVIENREAAVGAQVFHLRQRWGAGTWRVMGVAARFAVLEEQLLASHVYHEHQQHGRLTTC